MLIPGDLPFEFKALELALELSSTSLDAQVYVMFSGISYIMHVSPLAHRTRSKISMVSHSL